MSHPNPPVDKYISKQVCKDDKYLTRHSKHTSLTRMQTVLEQYLAFLLACVASVCVIAAEPAAAASHSALVTTLVRARRVVSILFFSDRRDAARAKHCHNLLVSKPSVSNLGMIPTDDSSPAESFQVLFLS
eukprot:g10577.t1